MRAKRGREPFCLLLKCQDHTAALSSTLSFTLDEQSLTRGSSPPTEEIVILPNSKCFTSRNHFPCCPYHDMLKDTKGLIASTWSAAMQTSEGATREGWRHLFWSSSAKFPSAAAAQARTSSHCDALTRPQSASSPPHAATLDLCQTIRGGAEFLVTLADSLALHQRMTK